MTCLKYQVPLKSWHGSLLLMSFKGVLSCHEMTPVKNLCSFARVTAIGLLINDIQLLQSMTFHRLQAPTSNTETKHHVALISFPSCRSHNPNWPLTNTAFHLEECWFTYDDGQIFLSNVIWVLVWYSHIPERHLCSIFTNKKISRLFLYPTTLLYATCLFSADSPISSLFSCGSKYICITATPNRKETLKLGIMCIMPQKPACAVCGI